MTASDKLSGFDLIAMQNRFRITESNFSRQSLDDPDSIGYPYPNAASFDFAKTIYSLKA